MTIIKIVPEEEKKALGAAELAIIRSLLKSPIPEAIPRKRVDFRETMNQLEEQLQDGSMTFPLKGLYSCWKEQVSPGFPSHIVGKAFIEEDPEEGTIKVLYGDWHHRTKEHGLINGIVADMSLTIPEEMNPYISLRVHYKPIGWGSSRGMLVLKAKYHGQESDPNIVYQYSQEEAKSTFDLSISPKHISTRSHDLGEDTVSFIKDGCEAFSMDLKEILDSHMQ